MHEEAVSATYKNLAKHSKSIRQCSGEGDCASAKMKTLKILLALCCIVLSYGNSINSNGTYTRKSTDQVVADKNQFESAVQINETDLQPRLGVRSDLVSPGEFPYMVSIQSNGWHVCGGALVSSQHVLTAGHCIYNFITGGGSYGKELTVEVGSVMIGSGMSFRVKRLACAEHSVHNGPHSHWPDDIAMITLLNHVTFNNYIKFIRLPPPYFELPVGTEVVISGFGANRRKSAPSRVMRKTVLFTTALQSCNNFYNRRITNRQLCTIRESGFGTCEGDSGGPLMHNRRIVGVVSGGGPHCCVGNPDVFVSVSYFLPFIEYEMGIRNTYELNSIPIIFRDMINQRVGRYN